MSTSITFFYRISGLIILSTQWTRFAAKKRHSRQRHRSRNGGHGVKGCMETTACCLGSCDMFATTFNKFILGSNGDSATYRTSEDSERQPFTRSATVKKNLQFKEAPNMLALSLETKTSAPTNCSFPAIDLSTTQRRLDPALSQHIQDLNLLCP